MKRNYGIIIFTFIIIIIFGLINDGGITGSTIGLKSNIPVCPDCNVILILVDTLRADHVGAYGYDRNTTPNIDKLAKEGVLFKNMLAQSSWTKPGTASILTGLHPKINKANAHKSKLSAENILLSEVLEENGYDTYAFITNTYVGSTSGFNQGYDKFIDTELFSVAADKVNEAVIPIIENLEKTSKQFIYIHYLDPHYPYNSTEEFFALHNNLSVDEVNKAWDKKEATHVVGTVEEYVEKLDFLKAQTVNLYDDEILFNDKMIGNVIQALKERNMYNNSIIIIISDHGEEFMDHGSFGHGQTLYEEQLRVPWIMKVPTLGHKLIEKQVNQIDVMPTVLSLLDIKVPKNINGINVFNDKESEFSYAELGWRGYFFSSIHSPEDKLIIGATTDRITKTEFSKPKWFESSATITFGGEKLDLPIMSFSGQRHIQLFLDGELFDTITLKPGQGITKHLGFKTSKVRTLKLVSLSPCTNVSDFGATNDSRCFSFGIGIDSMEVGENILPYLAYFSLKEDPLEQNNLYTISENQQRIEELEENLNKYVNTENDLFVSPPITVKYKSEELERLKALGYI